MDDHLYKPVEADVLFSLLEKYLGESKPADSAFDPSEAIDIAVHVGFDLLRRSVRQSDATAIEVRFGLIHRFFVNQGLTELAAMIQNPRRQSKTAHPWTILDWITSVETEYRRLGKSPTASRK